ncbi:MAG: hypothetical protein KIIPBIDF_01166 [Candidatus Methanoperedenaceae archaeon GB50]|nr:MAG: hypothetical protein KIIPBIDF_01166 [Candidatus Methanoperedenaceae archaeon GB50]
MKLRAAQFGMFQNPLLLCLKNGPEGKEHNHALRCLARQLIKVIFKMLKEDRDYILKEEMEKAA